MMPCYLCAHPERPTHYRAVGKAAISVCVPCGRQWKLKVYQVPEVVAPSVRYGVEENAGEIDFKTFDLGRFR